MSPPLLGFANRPDTKLFHIPFQLYSCFELIYQK